jgi:tRNA (guanine-N7-)-methyltransferase
VNARIRTFKARRGRLTSQQRASLDLFGEHHYTESRLPTLDKSSSIALEIGFGMGETAIEFARRHPGRQWLAVDIHTPGIADLLALATAHNLPNLFVIEADVFAILDLIPPVQEIHSYFPDPWPKTKHHKRRLVTAERVNELAGCLEPNAVWHIATDWQPYAEAILEVFDADPQWSGGVIERPDRPVTGYERKAHRAGRYVTDLRFAYVADGSPAVEH